jgi:hypothetical protein
MTARQLTLLWQQAASCSPVDECVQLGYVLELCVAVEQQRGVVSPRKATGVQLLQVTCQAGDTLRI